MTRRLLIVRHAERPSIANGEVGDGLTLTENGVQATKHFARGLNEEIVSIHSSPILRCVQTAQLIADEHDYAHANIQPSRLLGDPGFFIEDADLAWQSWLDKGSELVNTHLLAGTETWPGFRDFDQAIVEMLGHMRAELSSCRSGLTVWVTHDTILATLASRLLPEPLTLADWPDFLGSLQVSCDVHDELLLTYVPVRYLP